MSHHRVAGAVLLLPLMAACAAQPPAAVVVSSHAHFDPAPMPFVRYGRGGGTADALGVPIPPKMPLGTGAVPVSASPARGSLVTGIRESF